MDAKEHAHLVVGYAVRAGTLPPPTSLSCAKCGGAAVIYHHHSGYGGELDFAVEALCYPCHYRAHPKAGQRAAAPVTAPTPLRPPRDRLARTAGRQLPALRTIRGRLALTQEEMALKVGVTPTTIYRLENGFRAYPATVRKLADALGVEPATLFKEPTDA